MAPSISTLNHFSSTQFKCFPRNFTILASSSSSIVPSFASSAFSPRRLSALAIPKRCHFRRLSASAASGDDNSRRVGELSSLSPEVVVLNVEVNTVLQLALVAAALLQPEFGAQETQSPKKKDGTEIHSRKGRKLQKEKTTVEVPEPPTTTTSMDSIFDDDALYYPVSIPEEVRAPITNEQQREIFKWMLEEKRKLRPNDPVEKKQIDEDKAILKQILCADTMPKF